MLFNLNISMYRSFQPNSVTTQQGSTGLAVRSFDLPMRPSPFTMLMVDCTEWHNGSAFKDYTIGRSTTKLDSLASFGESQRPWFKNYHFISKTDKSNYYSRPDGLPLSSPPNHRRRCEKEGGIAES
ncbi:MAG: hypothetical protein WCS37_02615 [Chloroflexota bacterium]|nr:hypothetical protein [Chloroflexota bacterium]